MLVIYVSIYILDMGKTDGNAALQLGPMCHIAHHIGETGPTSISYIHLPPDVHGDSTSRAAAVPPTESGDRARCEVVPVLSTTRMATTTIITNDEAVLALGWTHHEVRGY